jgi:hypothetical protein
MVLHLVRGKFEEELMATNLRKMFSIPMSDDGYRELHREAHRLEMPASVLARRLMFHGAKALENPLADKPVLFGITVPEQKRSA